MMLQAAALGVLLCSVSGFSIQAALENRDELSGNGTEEDDLSVSSRIERANVNVGKSVDGPLVFGDIAVPAGLENADPCTSRGCKWPMSQDGNVYVPYRIASAFSFRQRNTIVNALNSFAESTCIRFTPRSRQEDFLDIQSLGGCFSFIGRLGLSQTVSLDRQGCVFLDIIQHEMLHALGFDHEQTRSDRDDHVRILLQNVIPGQERNFRKIRTNNLGTPYDYMSVMHYGRFDFSRNGNPTIEPIPDRNAIIGRATRMSRLDIRRVNLLYKCNNTRPSSHVSKPLTKVKDFK
ncbi:hatching enzyme 1.2-like [Brachionichthys hirsutus]|uniref:hatching enzyme 1.2-like n=1 Tax=Brachionichthys hirsutus TaxID=412623 RepID=UPI003604C484